VPNLSRFVAELGAALRNAVGEPFTPLKKLPIGSSHPFTFAPSFRPRPKDQRDPADQIVGKRAFVAERFARINVTFDDEVGVGQAVFNSGKTFSKLD
jgi:hypothetical protein